MAKQYIKPFICFEPIAMNSDLSGGCSIDAEFAEFSCQVHIPEWGGETIFTDSLNCDWSNDEGNICYHISSISTTVFGS